MNRRIAGLLVLLSAREISAHGLAHEAARRWTWEPWTIVLLLVSAGLYGAGTRAIWKRAGVNRGVRALQAIAFAAGLLSIAVALLSPVAWLSEILFSVHMTQHEILMLISAPLLVFGQPVIAMLWAFPVRAREGWARWAQRGPVVAAWRMLTAPLVVFLLHAAAIWVWHAPAFYEAALRSTALHAVEHLCFVISATLFWWGMVHGRYGRMAYGAGVLYVFLTAIHTSVLGALMTIAPGVLYPSYLQAGAAWHVDALEDQQLAGLLMWVPSALIFIVFGLALFAAWLGESGRRAALGSIPAARRTTLLLAAIAIALGSACNRPNTRDEAMQLTGGDPDRGVKAIGRYGCGSCHTIPGIRGANALVGPPLTRIARRSYLAGEIQNTPANMVRWIRHPRQIEKGTVMPEMGVTETDARDIAAYLYTLR